MTSSLLSAVTRPCLNPGLVGRPPFSGRAGDSHTLWNGCGWTNSISPVMVGKKNMPQSTLNACRNKMNLNAGHSTRQPGWPLQNADFMEDSKSGEQSVIMETDPTCTVLWSSHLPHTDSEHSKCGCCHWWRQFSVSLTFNQFLCK